MWCWQWTRAPQLDILVAAWARAEATAKKKKRGGSDFRKTTTTKPRSSKTNLNERARFSIENPLFFCKTILQILWVKVTTKNF